MSVQGVRMPYYYDYNSRLNNVPVVAQQPIFPIQEFPAQQEASTDLSLADQCVTNVGLFGGIKAVQYGSHPINNIKGLINAGKTYADNAEALKNLSATQKGEAFSNLFTASRLEPRFSNKSAEFTSKLAELQNNYINALKKGAEGVKGAEVEIAKAGAELTTFAKRSKSGIINGTRNVWHNFKNPLPVAENASFWDKTVSRVTGSFRGPSLEMATDPAIKNGASAAKLATDTKAAVEGLTGFQKIVGTGKQWFKQGGGWFAVGIEALSQTPELIAAYSEGEKGDGIKQTAKSAVTIGVNTAGWIVGAKVGTIAGAKLGALIGSICPGAGNAIGAAVGGFVGSLVGMAVGCWGASKTSKAIVGKSFTEQKAEKLAKKQQIAQQMLMAQQKLNPNYATNPFYKQGIQIPHQYI